MWRLRDDATGLVVEEADGLRMNADLIDFQQALRWSSTMVQGEAPPTAPPPIRRPDITARLERLVADRTT
jgi:hypothetical protein